MIGLANGVEALLIFEEGLNDGFIDIDQVKTHVMIELKRGKVKSYDRYD